MSGIKNDGSSSPSSNVNTPNRANDAPATTTTTPPTTTGTPPTTTTSVPSGAPPSTTWVATGAAKPAPATATTTTPAAATNGTPFDAKGSATVGPITVSGSATGVANLDAQQIQTANATGALKAVLGGTTINANGTLSVVNNKLTTAQLTAAVQTLFGPNAQLNADGTFSLDPKNGISAQLSTEFKNVYGALTLDTKGTIALKDGALTGSLQENLKDVLGSNTVIANNQVMFDKTGFASADLNDELIAKFGPNASLDTQVKASIDKNGIASANLTAAFKTMLGGNTTLDTTGTGFTLKNNKLTDAQFKAAVTTLFGPNAKLTTTGTFTYDKSSGVSAEVASAFKATYPNASVDIDGDVTIKGGKASGTISENVKALLGDETIVANNQVQFKDNAFQSATLDDELISKFGKSASLDTTFKASLDREGVETATATAAFKALIGNTSIDTTGTGVTIKNNTLTDAQFKAAIATTFGPNAQLSANGTYTWNKDSGVSANLVGAFKLAKQNVNLDVNGTLSIVDGKASGELDESLKAVLGPETITANNQVVFKDNGFESATLNDSLVSRFGKSASLSTMFQASLNKDGLTSANATASFKALVGNTSIDTTGTGITITNNKLTAAQFKAAIQTQFGPNAQLSANGTYTWNSTSGVSADAVAAFKGTYNGLSVDANGTISVKGGKASGTLVENIKATLGPDTVIADNQIVFKDNGFQSATLNDELISKFGTAASLDTTFKASLDKSGIASATATASFKALLGGTSIDTTGTGLTITNNKLSAAEFAAAIASQFGPNAKLTAAGTYVWNKDSGVTASVVADFKETKKNLTLDASGSGNLTLAPGAKLDGRLTESITATLGDNAIVSNNTVVFKDSKFDSATLEDSLTHKFGTNGSLSATVNATIKENGLVDGTVKIAALKSLKEHGVSFSGDASVTIKDDKVDRAEVSALLTVLAGKTVNVGAGGDLVYADGQLNPTLTANLKATLDNTTINGTGALTLVDGKPQVTAQVSALLGGPTLKGGGTIAVTGADSARVSLQLQNMGQKTQFSETGSLQLDKGKLTSASLTTNLVTQGKSPADVSLTGLISVTDGKAEADLKAQATAGIVSGGLGIGASSTVKLYTPAATDKERLAVQSKGGVWAERDASFDVNANANVGGTMMIGAVPVTLGFKADGDKARTVHALTIHPSKADALNQSPVTVIHPPGTVDQLLAMRPYEQFSDAGTQSIGMGGNASVGFGAGPAAIKAGGSVYYQITGNLSRDIERLDGNKVRIRFERGDGKSDIKALSASIGLDAGKLGGDNALVQKAAPLVASVAQAGVSASWEKMKQNDTVFDATIDLSTDQGKNAMQRLLKGDLSEAQYWAGYKNSGVQLNSELETSVTANTKKLDLNIGPLTKENVTRFLDKQQTSFSPKDVNITEAVDQVRSNKALLPWNSDHRADTRFIHQTSVQVTGDLPEAGEITGETTMHTHIQSPDPTRPATLADSAGMVGLRMHIANGKTSKNQAEKNIDRGLAVMDAVGFSPKDDSPFDNTRGAVDALAPKKQPIIPIFGGIGDQRFNATAVDVEAFLGPKGFTQVFSGRTSQDFKNAYVNASAVDGSILSTKGTRAAIEQTLGAQLVPAKAGGFDVMKAGQRIGTLSDADIAETRQTIVGLSSQRDGFSANIKPTSVGTWVAKPPDVLVHVTPQNWGNSNAVLKRADAFSKSMTQAQTLWSANQPPVKANGETAQAFQQRLATWEDTSLFKKPDDFYSQMDDLFRRALASDKTPNTGIAIMGLAGPDHIYGKSSIEIPADKLKGMIDQGRANVQRFGAVDVLAGLGARIDAGGNLVIPSAPENIDIATIAAKQLFGPGATATRTGSTVTFSGLTDPAPQFRQGLQQLLDSVTTRNGAMKLSAVPAAKQQQMLAQVFGPSAVVDNGNVVFDNRQYGIVHFGDALSMFKGGFGVYGPGEAPPQFPTLVPIEDKGAAQSYDATGLTARHDGAESHWGDAFASLEYLHGANEDLGATKAANPNGWILSGAQ